jgi:hypothetical protein
MSLFMMGTYQWAKGEGPIVLVQECRFCHLPMPENTTGIYKVDGQLVEIL